MPCSRYKIPGGGTALVKHSAPTFPICKFCPRDQNPNRAPLLCDFVMMHTHGGAAITCDAPICQSCAKHRDGKDFCPRHA